MLEILSPLIVSLTGTSQPACQWAQGVHFPACNLPGVPAAPKEWRGFNYPSPEGEWRQWRASAEVPPLLPQTPTREEPDRSCIVRMRAGSTQCLTNNKCQSSGATASSFQGPSRLRRRCRDGAKGQRRSTDTTCFVQSQAAALRRYLGAQSHTRTW